MKDLSIIVVNYNTGNLLKECIESIKKNALNISYEIIVIDNNSSDNSVDLIKNRFENLEIIINKINVGFARANNQGIKKSKGRYILLLNPDTVILPDCLKKMMKFMDDHPGAGVAGCKVLNPNGTLQLACRRSFPAPSISFYRLTGLSRLFPKSKTFARYNLTYQNPDVVREVDAVSGSFMMIIRKAMNEVGMLDEQFFMYGEELDLCFRIKEKGWKVYYVPDARIIHYKGSSSQQRKRKAVIDFHKAMYIFHKKHYANHTFFLLNWLIILGITLRAGLFLVLSLFKKS